MVWAAEDFRSYKYLLKTEGAANFPAFYRCSTGLLESSLFVFHIFVNVSDVVVFSSKIFEVIRNEDLDYFEFAVSGNQLWFSAYNPLSLLHWVLKSFATSYSLSYSLVEVFFCKMFRWYRLFGFTASFLYILLLTFVKRSMWSRSRSEGLSIIVFINYLLAIILCSFVLMSRVSEHFSNRPVKSQPADHIRWFSATAIVCVGRCNSILSCIWIYISMVFTVYAPTPIRLLHYYLSNPQVRGNSTMNRVE